MPAKMPPRKEPKEAVVYPASKRKAPPFKPQRPSKVPRIPTTESESSTRAGKVSKAAVSIRRKSIQDDKDDDSEIENTGRILDASDDDNSSDEELEENPLAARPTRPTKPTKPTKPTTTTKPAAPKRKPAREPSPMSLSSQHSSPPPERPSTAPDPPPEPTQSDGVPGIPQPLLVRLLHEHFSDQKTKIDKHAIQVLQKYFETFVRETIARAAQRKKEDAEQSGVAEDSDTRWLELEDLEKVAAGMLLDF